MHQRNELPFGDEFRWVSPFHFVKNEWQNAVPLWCMLQMGPPFLLYCCAVVLRSSIVMPPVSHFSNREYHCSQLRAQSSCVSKFYHTFKDLIWLCFVFDTKRSSYHNICAVLSNDTAQYHLVLVPKWRLVTIVSMDPWMCSLRCLLWRQNRIRSLIFRVLVHVIWLLDIPISELGTRFCKVEISP